MIANAYDSVTQFPPSKLKNLWHKITFRPPPPMKFLCVEAMSAPPDKAKHFYWCIIEQHHDGSRELTNHGFIGN